MTEISHSNSFHKLTAEHRRQTPRTRQKKRTRSEPGHFSRSPDPQQAQSGRSLLVLVAEDNEMVRTLIASMLKLLGHATVCAKDAFEAAEVFYTRQKEIDVVLSDVVMPGQSGWDLLKDLRKNGVRTPVILASGYYENPAKPSKPAEQPQAFLHKPFTIKKLENALELALAADIRSDLKRAPLCLETAD